MGSIPYSGASSDSDIDFSTQVDLTLEKLRKQLNNDIRYGSIKSREREVPETDSDQPEQLKLRQSPISKQGYSPRELKAPDTGAEPQLEPETTNSYDRRTVSKELNEHGRMYLQRKFLNRMKKLIP
jgi:hypothetical protein